MLHRHGAILLLLACLLSGGCATGRTSDNAACNGTPTTKPFSCGDNHYLVTYCCSEEPVWRCDGGVGRIILYDGWAVVEGVNPNVATQNVVITGLPSREERTTTQAASTRLRLLVGFVNKGHEVGYVENGIVSMKGRGIVHHPRECAEPGKPLGYLPSLANLWNDWCDPDYSSLPNLENPKDNAAAIEKWFADANAKCSPHKPATMPCK